MYLRSFRGFVFVAMLAASATAQDRSKPQAIDSCIRFATGFFRWYVPFTQMRLDGPAFGVATEQKSAAFAPELLRALRIDAQAQAKAGEIVGLDFDPFLGSQDPAEHYSVRNAIEKDNLCTVEVWRDSRKDTAAKPRHPDAIAELGRYSAGWRFTNFKYPEINTDLLHTLALLRKERDKS